MKFVLMSGVMMLAFGPFAAAVVEGEKVAESATVAESTFAANDRPARTPVQQLVDAAGTGDTNTVRRLLDSGQRASEGVPGTGAQALHQASANGHAGLVTLLLEHGADVNAADRDGATPLVYAAYTGRLNVIDVLLAAGAQVDVLPERQVHALNAAVMSGSVDTVRRLIQAGADPDLKDRFGKSARDYTTQLARPDLAVVFQTTMADSP